MGRDRCCVSNACDEPASVSDWTAAVNVCVGDDYGEYLLPSGQIYSAKSVWIPSAMTRGALRALADSPMEIRRPQRSLSLMRQAWCVCWSSIL